MLSKEYYYLLERQKSIRNEINTIRRQPIRSVEERIRMLKETNLLLKEQNEIIRTKQILLSKNLI